MIEITGKFKESIPVIAPKIAVKEKVLSPNIAVFLDPSRRCFFSLTSLSSPITAPIKNAKIYNKRYSKSEGEGAKRAHEARK